jgi:hypothetical protein
VIMEPGEALGLLRRLRSHWPVAVVVVVFRPEAVHEWSGIDKLRLRLLLANSILPLGLSMLGLLLLTVEPMPPGIWRWCSGITLVAILLFVTAVTKMFRHLNLQNAQRQRDTDSFFTCSPSAWQPRSGKYSTLRYSAHSGHFSRESYTNSSRQRLNLHG